MITARNFLLSLLAIALIATSPFCASSPTPDLQSLTSETVPLPNGCEVLAAQAHARLCKAGVWTRILIVSYEQGGAHALCVFQPSWQICVYDASGTVELDTDSHDPAAIANLLAIRKGWRISQARFLK